MIVSNSFTAWMILIAMMSGNPGVTEKDRLQQTTPAEAKRIRIRGPQPNPNLPSGDFHGTDRRIREHFKEIQEQIEKKNFGTGIPLLQRLYEQQHDSFTLAEKESSQRVIGFRNHLEQYMFSLPTAAHDVYNQLYGATAQRMWNDAKSELSLAKTAEVVHRYPLTKASREALYLLSVFYFDHGDFSAAAHCLRKLESQSTFHSASRRSIILLRLAQCWLHTGFPQRALQTLEKLIALVPNHQLTMGPQTIKIESDTQKQLAWLKQLGTAGKVPGDHELQWRMFARNHNRNPVYRSPRNSNSTSTANWTQSLLNDPLKSPAETGSTPFDSLLNQLVNELKTQQPHSQPSQLYPLVSDGKLIVRTVGNVMVFDLNTGKREWQTMAETRLAELLQPGEKIAQHQTRYALRNLVQQRLWRDSTHGLMSSDGTRLYTIEELGADVPVAYTANKPAAGQPPVRTVVNPPDHNTLVAYHLIKPDLSGHRAWTVGGKRNDELFELPLAGTFFLGAPIPYDGSLFVLADQSGEIQILELNPANGEKLWSQPIASVSPDIESDRHRRNAGLAATISEGFLVAQTNTGQVTCIDLDTRSLFWGYQLPSPAGIIDPPPRPIPVPLPGPRPIPRPIPLPMPKPGPRPIPLPEIQPSKRQNQIPSEVEKKGNSKGTLKTKKNPVSKPVPLGDPLRKPKPIPRPLPGPKPAPPIIPVPNPNGNLTSTWWNTPPLIVDGRVFVTPQTGKMNERELYCLDLLSGELLWRQSSLQKPATNKPEQTAPHYSNLSGKELYLAGVNGKQLLVVAENSFKSFHIETGKQIWNVASKFPQPSGRGFLRGSQFFLPTTSQSIVVINSLTGEKIRELKIPGAETRGNLIGVGNQLILQDIDRVTVFPDK